MLCSDCAGKSLGIYISRHGYKGQCRFCSKQKEKVLPCNEVENFLLDAWRIIYEDADNYGSSAFEEIDPLEITDLLEKKDELELDDTNEQFLKEIENDFEEKQWFPLGEYIIQGPEEMLYNWEQFCKIVKTKWRYTFPFVDNEENSIGFTSSNNILKTVSKLVTEYNCISKITPDIPIYRGRNFKNKKSALVASAKDIGSPKPENAIQPNRFSPEGISMFYGCLDYNTVEQEIGKEKYLIIGEFHTSKEISVLDLTALPKYPALYDDENNIFMSAITFLHEFSCAISKDIKGESKLDYIPTQIFTEYIRQIGLKKFNIQGIKYHSAKCPCNDNLVLFFENKDCIDDDLKYSANKTYMILKKKYSTIANWKHRE